MTHEKLLPAKLHIKAAEKWFDFVASLYESRFPIGRDNLHYLEANEYFGSGRAVKKVPTLISQLETTTSVRPAILVAPTVSEKQFFKQTPPRPSTGPIIIEKSGIEDPHQNWMVSYENFNDQMWAWINSINSGFQHIIPFQPLDDYIRQANSWLQDKRRIEHCKTSGDQDDYVKNEVLRFRANKLYFLNKYWRYIDQSSRTGYTIFQAPRSGAILAYLYDCMWDLDIAKARQIFFTTEMYGLAMAELLINPTYFCKYITADTTKAKETFLQKFRLPFFDLPTYIRPVKPTANSEEYFELFRDKINGGGATGIRVVGPSVDAINSGSPDLRLIDEQGLISILKEMKNEMKASSLKPDEKKGRLVKKGRTISWGSSDNIQFPEFENLFKGAKEQWESKNISEFTAIPIFINVWGRHLFTQDVYDAHYNEAYATQGLKRSVTITQFHQSFPIDLEDMFMSNPATLIDMEVIQSSLRRIDSLEDDKLRCEYGYFMPVWDHGNTIVKSIDQPAHIIGSEWIQCKGPEDPRVTSIMFSKRVPGEKWINRWVAGTDPIMGVSGHSNFAKTIMDKLTKSPACLVDFRTGRPEDTYLQGLLASLYYGLEIPELLEINWGAPYLKYCTENGYGDNFIVHKSLPDIYQIETSEIFGIAKKGMNARNILNALWEYLFTHHQDIWIRTYYNQLKTYVNKPSTQGSKKGGNVVVTNQFRFGPKDPDFHFDDALDSLAYAAIAMEVYGFANPKNLEETTGERVMRYVRKRDANMNLITEIVESYQ